MATKAGELVKGLIDDLITPLLLSPVLKKLKLKNIEELSYRGVLYGKVISTLIDFTITAFLIFLIIRYAHVAVVSAPIK
ncbi:MAG: MscL family protein [bacterium]